MSAGGRRRSLAGRVPLDGQKGAHRFARASTGSCALILELGLRFHSRGPVTQRCPFHAFGLAESPALMGSGEGKLMGSLAAAGQRGEGVPVQARVTAADLRLCLKRTERGGTAALAARMVTGVDMKQLGAHRRALCQRISSFWAIAPLGTKRSAPYKMTGKRSADTKRRVCRVVRPEPRGDSFLINANAACTRANLWLKWAEVARFGENQ